MKRTLTVLGVLALCLLSGCKTSEERIDEYLAKASGAARSYGRVPGSIYDVGGPPVIIRSYP